MTDSQPTDPTPEPEAVPLSERVNRNIQAAITRAGKRYSDIEKPDALGLTHSAAVRRRQGAQEWRFSEVEAVANWLDIDPDVLTTIH